MGLHHLSPQSGCVGISSDTPFPDRTPPAGIVRPGHELKTGGYSTEVVLVPVLALAPDMLLSQHPAPTSRFPWLGEPRAWGLATPRSIALRMKSSGCGRVGGPPMHRMHVHWWAAGSTRERCRTLFTFLVQVNGYARQLRITRRATPPSFDVIAVVGYHVVV